MTESHFNGSANRTIVLDDVQCTGSEATLLNCSHSPLGSHDCSLSEAAGVSCGTAEGRFTVQLLTVGHVTKVKFSRYIISYSTLLYYVWY